MSPAPPLVDTVRFGALVSSELLTGSALGPHLASLKRRTSDSGIPVTFIGPARLRLWRGGPRMWFIGFEASTSTLMNRPDNLRPVEMTFVPDIISTLWDQDLKTHPWLPDETAITLRRVDLVRDFTVPHPAALLRALHRDIPNDGRKRTAYYRGARAESIASSATTGWRAILYDKGAQMRSRKRPGAPRDVLRYELQLRNKALKNSGLGTVAGFTRSADVRRLHLKYFDALRFGRIVDLDSPRGPIDLLAGLPEPLDRTSLTAVGLLVSEVAGKDVRLDPATRKRYAAILDAAQSNGVVPTLATGKTTSRARLDYPSASLLYVR